MNIQDDMVLNLEDIATQFGVPIYRLKREIKSGSLRARKTGKTYLVSGKEVLAWVEHRNTTAFNPDAAHEKAVEERVIEKATGRKL